MALYYLLSPVLVVLVNRAVAEGGWKNQTGVLAGKSFTEAVKGLSCSCEREDEIVCNKTVSIL